MNTPFFSVIVASYNRSSQLRETVESVRNQTLQDFEIIVADDCSTDDSREVLNNIDENRLSFYSTSINSGGPSIPRNLGMEKAKGEWLCFCDSDDVFTPDHLATFAAFIRDQQDKNCIISTNAFLNMDGRHLTETYFKKSKPGLRKISVLQDWKANRAILSALCIRNQDIIRFREAHQYRSIEDYIFLLENMLNGKSHFFIDRPTIYYSARSNDSIRFIYNSGAKIYKYKWELIRKYRLWKSPRGVVLTAITGSDYFKYFGKQLINRLRPG